jgi:CheY-like chemotaxis protein
VRADSSADQRPLLRGKQILVVEDEAVIAMEAENQLRGEGATVIGPAASVDEALRLVEVATAVDGGIDAAVLDVKLGDGTVRPVADRLAALGVPFVYATGYGVVSDAAGAHAAAPVLHKPFEPEELVAALHGLTSGSRGVRQTVHAAAAGLTGERGRKPDAETARITWEAVCATARRTR